MRLRLAAARRHATRFALVNEQTLVAPPRWYGEEPAHVDRAVLIVVPGDRPELALAQLIWADAAAPRERIALGLAIRDPVLQAEISVRAQPWSEMLGRPLFVLYGAPDPDAHAARRLREQLGLQQLYLVDGRWTFSGVADWESITGVDGEDAPEPAMWCASATYCAARAAPPGSAMNTVRLPIRALPAGRFGGVLPWIERGLRVLDGCGRVLGVMGLARSGGMLELRSVLCLPDGSWFLTGTWSGTAGLQPQFALFDGDRALDLQGYWVLLPETLPTLGAQLLGDADSSQRLVAYVPAALLEQIDRSPRLRARIGAVTASVCALRPRPAAARPDGARAILAELPLAHPRLRELLDYPFGPAVQALATPRVERAPRWQQYGPEVQAPKVSLIVPLYGRADFLRHQLAHFMHDAEFARVDLIYAIDDPRLVEVVNAEAAALAFLCGASFRTVHAGCNLGYAGANNLAATGAHAPLMLLLNSDVMPQTPGWIGRMADRFATDDSLGIAGARLVFEDGSIQHAGMRSEPYAAWGGIALNLHPGKALMRAPTRASETVEAVTGACLMLRTAFYRELGGLDEGFLIGDFEDSELCARVRARGLRIELCNTAQLVHLERQSIAGDPERAAMQARFTIYNAWRAQRCASGVAA